MTLLWLVSLAALPRDLAGQDIPVLEPLESSESWLDEVPVSGGVRAGLMAGWGVEPPDLDALMVAVPATDASRLCVELSSRDGRYRAEAEYRIDGRPGPARLLTATEYGDRLSSYGAGEVAILARLGDSCDQPEGPFVVAGWGTVDAEGELSVLLNSRVPTYVLAGRDGLVEHEERCEELEGVTTAFNLRCGIRAAWLGPGAEVVIRMRRGRSFTTIPLPIAVPDTEGR